MSEGTILMTYEHLLIARDELRSELITAYERIAALEAERKQHAELMSEETRQIDGFHEEVPKLLERIRALEADLALLSDKACTAVVRYRTALQRLTDSFKYSTEVVTMLIRLTPTDTRCSI